MIEQHNNSRPAKVIGPLGEPLTLDTLPPPTTTRWVVRRKAEVVAAVSGGLLSVDDVCARYGLTVEEFAGWQRASVIVGVLLALVLLANLVTLTTRTSDLLDVVVRVCGPLRRVGVDPERVGLMLQLAIRAVPLVIDLGHRVRSAQHARGLTASPRAFAVPLIVGAMRRADELGDALAARGLDD